MRVHSCSLIRNSSRVGGRSGKICRCIVLPPSRAGASGPRLRLRVQLLVVRSEWQGVTKLMTPSGEQELIVINEAAVYKLAFRSNKATALRRLAGPPSHPEQRERGAGEVRDGMKDVHFRRRSIPRPGGSSACYHRHRVPSSDASRPECCAGLCCARLPCRQAS
jgi:hypothetical protein